MKRLKKIWNDPVLSTVWATAILVVVGIFWSSVAGWWPSIWQAVVFAWAWLFESTPTARWLLIILGGATAFLLCALVYGFWMDFRDEAPNIEEYTVDEFFGIRWRWKFIDKHTYDFTSFCIRCDYQIIPTDVSAYSAVPLIVYRCDECGHDASVEVEHPRHMNSRIERMVHKKLRNGEWLRVVERQRAQLAEGSK